MRGTPLGVNTFWTIPIRVTFAISYLFIFRIPPGFALVFLGNPRKVQEALKRDIFKGDVWQSDFAGKFARNMSIFIALSKANPQGEALSRQGNLVSLYSETGDTSSWEAPYSAIGFRDKLFLRYPPSTACLCTAIGHLYGMKWGCSSDDLRYHRKHSATGVLLHLCRVRGAYFGWVTKQEGTV